VCGAQKFVDVALQTTTRFSPLHGPSNLVFFTLNVYKRLKLAQFSRGL
jgi:hypothetical protein